MYICVCLCFKNNIIEKNVVQTNRKNAVGFFVLAFSSICSLRRRRKTVLEQKF